MGSVWAMVVVEGDPATDASPRLRAGLPGVLVDAFILQGPPETLDENVVEAAPLSGLSGGLFRRTVFGSTPIRTQARR